MNKPTVNTRPVVIVSGADCATGLTAARALASIACDVWGLASDITAPCAHSRQWQRVFKVSTKECWLSELRSISQVAFSIAGVKPLLILSQDDWVLWADSHRQSLVAHIDIIIPDSGVLHTMMDKTAFHEWASNKKIPIPESIIVSNKSELEKNSDSLNYPYIIKPLVRSASWDKNLPGKKFISINCESDFACASQLEIFEYSEKYLLQEWIAGKDSDVYFCLFAVSSQGEILAEYGGRKLLQWPRLGGSTACCVTHKNAGLMDQAKTLVKLSKMVGLCSVEFKYDARCGLYKVTEPTVGRNDYQSYLANIGGVNITGALVENHFNMKPQQKLNNDKNNAVWIDEVAIIRIVKQLGLRSLLSTPSILSVIYRHKMAGLLTDKVDFTPLKLSLKRLFR